MAYLRGWNLLLGAVIAGVLTALGIGWLSRRSEVREDTAIGIMFTGMFALGILLISTARSFRDLSHMLFGNILGVTPGDLLVFMPGAYEIARTIVTTLSSALRGWVKGITRWPASSSERTTLRRKDSSSSMPIARLRTSWRSRSRRCIWAAGCWARPRLRRWCSDS